MKQFEEKGAQLLGLSCDTIPALKVWSQALGGIAYPLLSDYFPSGKVCQSLGIYNPDNGFTVRAVIIIDPQGIVRACHIYPPGVLPAPNEVLAELSSLQAA